MKEIRIFYLLVLFALNAFSLQAQKTDPKDFVPKGYKLLFEYRADLNADSIPDEIIIIGVDKSLGDSLLKTIFPSGTVYAKRPVLLLVGQADHSFRLDTRNNDALAQALANIDPFSTVKCATGTFTIEHTVHDGARHCTIDARFEWVPKHKDWYLKVYSQSCISTVSANPDDSDQKEKTDKNFGKIPFSKFRYPMSLEIDDWGQ